MSHDRTRPQPPDVVNLADVRRRLEAQKEDAVAPLRLAFIEELSDLLDEYIDDVREVTGDDEDKVVEEVMATFATALALAAEDQFEDVDDQVEFIDTVAEIAVELLTDEESQGELFDQD